MAMAPLRYSALLTYSLSLKVGKLTHEYSLILITPLAAEGWSQSVVPSNVLIHSAVDECKRALAALDEPNKGKVDWLTEVIRRFSEAAMAAKPLASINMKSPMRNEQVRSRNAPSRP